MFTLDYIKFLQILQGASSDLIGLVMLLTLHISIYYWLYYLTIGTSAFRLFVSTVIVVTVSGLGVSSASIPYTINASL